MVSCSHRRVFVCLFVKNSVIADKVSSVFFIPGVRTGVVAGVDWFTVTNVSLFDVDTTGVCVSVSAWPCVSESTPAGVTVESYNKPGMITYALSLAVGDLNDPLRFACNCFGLKCVRCN